jgi:hypothetical protein
VSKSGQIWVADLGAVHQHLAVLGAALQSGYYFAGVELALPVKGVFDAYHLGIPSDWHFDVE